MSKIIVYFKRGTHKTYRHVINRKVTKDKLDMELITPSNMRKSLEEKDKETYHISLSLDTVRHILYAS
jgi:hypothetical protein